MTGSGLLHVTTAALYAAGGRYLVTTGGSSRTVVADQGGRLTFPVDLGAAHTSEQTAFAAADTASWAHAAVSIAPIPAAAAGLAGDASRPGLANTSSATAATATGLAIAPAVILAAVAGGRRRRRQTIARRLGDSWVAR